MIQNIYRFWFIKYDILRLLEIYIMKCSNIYNILQTKTEIFYWLYVVLVTRE